MELDLNRLPDDAIPVPGFGGADVVSHVDTMLRVFQTDVPLVLFL
jgi:hypothetical protein